MKNVTFFACLFVLTLGASAQNARSVSPIAIPPNARGGEHVSANSIGITTIHLTPEVRSADAVAKPAHDGVPPVAKVPPNAIKVPPVAKK